MSQPPKRSVTVRRIRSRMTFFFILLMLVIVFTGSILIYCHVRSSAINNSRPQVTALDLQMAATINNFTAYAELDCTEAFRQGCITDYDPVTSFIKDYEAQTVKTDMKNRLLSLSAGRNYNDFFVLFSDSDTVGKVSSGTSELISRLGYDLFSDRLGGSGDCWFYSPAVSSAKVYYVRRATDHSLFVLSFYTEELRTLFYDVELSENTYALVNNNDVVIVSNETGLKTGSKLPDDINSLFVNKNGETVVKDSLLGASISVDAGWRIILVSPAPVDDLPINGILLISTIFFVSIIVICWLTGLAAAAPFRLEEIKSEGSEFTDPQTGRLNEYGLDENISETLETSLVGSTYAFIMLGVKDADQVRSAISAKYWDDTRTKLIEYSESFFEGKDFLIGRTSGDRIIIFVNYSEFDISKAHQNLKQNCTDFLNSFKDLAVGDDNSFKLHVNVGVSVYPDNAEDFDSLLEKASKAFSEANKASDDSFVLYDPAKYESEAQQ